MGVVRRRAADTFRWNDVPLERYVAGEGGGTKQVLIGPDDGAASFAVRYFEIAPGGASSLDTHAHDHGVVILRGRGTVCLGDERHSLGVGDVVYVSPGEVHQFESAGPEPLGFLCVVPARR